MPIVSPARARRAPGLLLLPALASLVAAEVARGARHGEVRDGAPHRAARSDTGRAYTFTTIDAPGAASTTAYGINNAGVVVGSVSDTAHHQRGFVRTPAGAFATFVVPGSPSTEAFGVNDAGVVVGAFESPGPPLTTTGHGFVRSADGALATFDVPGASTTYAYGVDAAGRVVGYCFSDTGEYGFISAARDDRPRGAAARGAGGVRRATFAGAFTTVAVPDSGRTTIYGINRAGTTVGTSEPGIVDTVHGFVRAPDGRITMLEPHGSPDHTEPRGVNAAGTVVGFYIDDRGMSGFVRTAAGRYSRVDVPGARATAVYGVNDAGVLVGAYTDMAGRTHGFVGAPAARRR